ncbi:hypothetical protein JZ751_024171 [Albula glossodonta]|uniref:Uncharacterized protein n=1 Tax=Albula glossodonta TaxID=121402 RepID=A0A8T2NIP9_9TELE|nr:hypothetical protein JZ751_024171 [Albula glossodonta]
MRRRRRRREEESVHVPHLHEFTHTPSLVVGGVGRGSDEGLTVVTANVSAGDGALLLALHLSDPTAGHSPPFRWRTFRRRVKWRRNGPNNRGLLPNDHARFHPGGGMPRVDMGLTAFLEGQPAHVCDGRMDDDCSGIRASESREQGRGHRRFDVRGKEGSTNSSLLCNYVSRNSSERCWWESLVLRLPLYEGGSAKAGVSWGGGGGGGTCGRIDTPLQLRSGITGGPQTWGGRGGGQANKHSSADVTAVSGVTHSL